MSAEHTRNGVGDTAQAPALHEQKTSQDLNVASTASGGELTCVRITYERCSPLSVTELLVKRARQEPPGVRLAILHIWRVIMSGLNAKTQFFEPL